MVTAENQSYVHGAEGVVFHAVYVLICLNFSFFCHSVSITDSLRRFPPFIATPLA